MEAEDTIPVLQRVEADTADAVKRLLAWNLAVEGIVD